MNINTQTDISLPARGKLGERVLLNGEAGYNLMDCCKLLWLCQHPCAFITL